MTALFLAFFFMLITAAASFLGSLQAGVVNTAVLTASLRHGPRYATSLAIGGAAAEFLYAGLAAWLTWGQLHWLDTVPTNVQVLVQGSTGTLIGAYLIWTGMKLKPWSPNHDGKDNTEVSGPALTTMKGLALGMVNFQLLPFWLGFCVGMMSFSTGTSLPIWLIVFSIGLGASLGAYTLLNMVIKLSGKLQQNDTVPYLWTGIKWVLVGFGGLAMLSSIPRLYASLTF